MQVALTSSHLLRCLGFLYMIRFNTEEYAQVLFAVKRCIDFAENMSDKCIEQGEMERANFWVKRYDEFKALYLKIKDENY